MEGEAAFLDHSQGGEGLGPQSSSDCWAHWDVRDLVAQGDGL